MYQRSPVEPRRNRPARGTLKCPSGRTYQSLRKPTPEGHLSVPLEKGWDILSEQHNLLHGEQQSTKIRFGQRLREEFHWLRSLVENC